MKAKYGFLIIFLITLALAGFLLTQKNPSQNKTVTDIYVVVMKEDVVEPETLTIKKGTTVIFKNEDKVARWPASNLHPTHTIYPEFDPKKPIEPGESWSFTFGKVGEWKHHDHLLPAIRGLIIVTE